MHIYLVTLRISVHVFVRVYPESVAADPGCRNARSPANIIGDNLQNTKLKKYLLFK